MVSTYVYRITLVVVVSHNSVSTLSKMTELNTFRPEIVRKTRHRWMGNITIDLGETGLGGVD